MSKTATKEKAAGAFAGMGGMLSGGLSDDFTNSDHMIQIDVADIEFPEQQVRDRDNMEDDENTLDDLGDSLAKRQAQNIIVRPNPNFPHASSKPYQSVAGERRVRASLKKGIPKLWALVAELTDEEAEDLQMAENIHRKNLTQMEEAKRVQRDLDKFGTVEAVLAKHNKSRAWLSKILALLHLPEQAKRLVKENISADLEVINTVKTIEKADPKKAKELVDDLKATRGKANARERAAAVKEDVKPSKKDKKPAGGSKDTGGSVATSRDRSHEEPGQGEIVFADAKSARGKAQKEEEAHVAPLVRAYIAVFENKKSPESALKSLTDDEREAVESFLHTFYEAGKQAQGSEGIAARMVIEGFRFGGFASDGVGAFALVAYLHGNDGKAKFNLLNVFGCLKP